MQCIQHVIMETELFTRVTYTTFKLRHTRHLWRRRYDYLLYYVSIVEEDNIKWKLPNAYFRRKTMCDACSAMLRV